MQLEATAVNPGTAKRTGKITGNVDFYLYLLKMKTLSGKHSAQRSIPFLKSDSGNDDAIWFSKKLQDEYALNTVEGLTEFCEILKVKAREYDICIIEDGTKPAAWCLYKKGANEARTVATVSIADTADANTVATVK